MTQEVVEQALGLDVRFRQAPCGVTMRSTELFHQAGVRRRIGPVVKVVLAYVTEPAWDFLTYVVDAQDRALCFDGFAWGYGGEGPRGLVVLLRELGFETGRYALPPAHEPGAWVVLPSGLIHRA